MRSKIIRRTLFLTAVLTIAICTHSGFAAQGDWTTYTNMNVVSQVLLDGETLWCATTGGVAVVNTSDAGITQLNNVQGLGGNYVYAVAVDTSGAFWFGSQNGALTKYRPQENDWRVYYLADRDGRRLRIKDLFADGEQVWIGTDIGVSLFFIYKHGGEIKETYRRLGEPFAGEEDVAAVLVVGDRIWVGTEAGVATAKKDDPNLLDYSRWTAFTSETSPGLSNDHVLCIVDMEGEIVVGTEQGVFGFDSSDSTWHSLGLGSRMVNDLKYQNQTLFAATNQGLYQYDGQGWTHVTDSGLLSTYLNSVEINPSGNLWVGTNGEGIAAFAGSEWETYTIAGPPANTFVDMEIDDRGNLWCAQDGSGACVFDGSTWSSLNSVPQIDGHIIKAVEKDMSGNLWFSSWGGGVIKLDPDSAWTRYTEQNSPLKGIPADPAYVVVNDIAVDQQGNRWFPNWESLDSTRIVCSPGQGEDFWVIFYERDGISSTLMLSVITQGGHLYVCFRDAGLLDYDYNWTLADKNDDRAVRYTSDDDHLSDNTVTAAAVDKDGTLWVGTVQGLDKFDADFERFRSVPLPEPLGLQVNHIAVDQRNNKWIATSNGLGMINSRGDFVHVFTTSDSKICGDNVLRLKIDQETGDVWIGTGNGLSRYESGIGAPAENLSQVRAFPNPFVIESGMEIVTFDRLPYQAQVRIFTVAGELVREIKQGDQWNGRNQSGELVASGVYLFHVQDPSGKSAVGKIAVIRQ
jgi:ligand-binding sensor domain-containing protein